MYGAQAYASINAATDTPWALIDMLYEGAVQRIDQDQIDKALRIVEEGLLGALDPNVPMSRGLADVYEGVLVHLSPGGHVPTARQMLVTMREGWAAVKEQMPHA